MTGVLEEEERQADAVCRPAWDHGPLGTSGAFRGSMAQRHLEPLELGEDSLLS